MIVGLLAQKRNGKDTVADHLTKDYGFQKYSLADPFKKACQDMFMFTDEQCWGDQKEVVDPRWGVTPREVFMIMGTEISQYDLMKHLPAMAATVGDEGKRIWFHRFKLEAEQHPERNYVIADVRFLHEVDSLKAIEGHVIKIVRPGFENGSTHASEAQVNLAPYDDLIMNDSTLDVLYGRVDDVMVQLGLKKTNKFKQYLGSTLFMHIVKYFTLQR